MDRSIRLKFDPMQDDNLKRVFADDIARKLWLIYRPNHIVSNTFWSTCLGLAEMLRRETPESVQHFAVMLNCVGDFYYYGNQALQEAADFIFPKLSEPEPKWEIIH